MLNGRCKDRMERTPPVFFPDSWPVFVLFTYGNMFLSTKDVSLKQWVQSGVCR